MFYRHYMLAVLCMAGSVVSTEGVALTLVAQDLKRDLALTDVQIGLLQGFAFLLCYAFAGLSIARWVDRGNRVAIISLATAAWGIFLAASGTATGFWQLVFLRAGVAFGEAGCAPAAQSLIREFFDRAERPRANAIYFAMTPVVMQLVGSVLGGKLNEVYGWRPMFMILSLPGFAIAILAFSTLREPRREQHGPVGRFLLTGKVAMNTRTSPRVKDVLHALWSNTTLRHLYLLLVVQTFTLVGVGCWQAVFFVRSYGLKTGELGAWFAFVGILGAVGSLAGGAWCSRYAANNERRQFRVIAIAVCGLAIVYPSVYLVHNYHLALGLVGLSTLLSVAFTGPTWAIVQTLVPRNMLASGVAVLILSSNLIGGGLGPLVAGALSDVLQPRFGNESLIYASLALCPGFLWAAWHSWKASKSVTADLVVAQEEQDGGDGDTHAARISQEIS
jgi:MFS family permease